ncbi:MAG: autotransporter-associated beta strand repeat-containing protein, partial [Pirellulaceae bacterium]|nr:autotransporter-associated beta strand repeat-containing protein [Pirellulaceae bacterium]
MLAQLIWDGGGANDLWSNPLNWQNDIAPTAGDDLVFAATGAGASINDLPAGTRFSTISISGTGYTFSESASNPIELIGGLVSSHTTGTNTWNIDVTLLNAVSVFNATSGTTLDIGGDINTANVLGSTGVGVGGTSALTFDGDGDVNVTGNITGAGGITKLGAGRTTLSGNNTFEGIVTIRQGALRAASDTALGADTGFTDVANGGTALELAGVNIVGEALAIREAGVGFGSNLSSDGMGALRAVSGSNTWTGGIQLALTAANSDHVIGVDTGATLDISGVIAAPIDAARDLLKVGGGTLRLSGTNPNVLTGVTTVLEGTLELGKTAGVNAIGGSLVIGTNFNGNDTAVVRLLADNQLPHLDFFNAALTSLTINPSGLLDLGAFDDVIGNLTMQTGPVASADITGTAASLLSLGGNVTLTGGFQGSSGASPAATITANVDLGPLFSGGTGGTIGHVERTFTIGDSQLTDVAADLVISGVISGAADIQMVKAGAGTLRLTGNNTYLGGTLINGGITEIGHDNAFGASTSTLSFVSGQLAAFGAARNIDNPFAHESGNALDILGQHALEFSGLTTFANGNKTIGVMHPNGVVEFSGGIQQWLFGNINLAKRGLGELVISAPATFGGTTTVNDNDGGTLRLVDGGTLPYTNAITVGINGRLVLDNTAGTLDRLNDNTNLSVSGTLVLIGQTNAATVETVGVINNLNDRTTTIDIRNTGTGSAQLIARRFDGAGVLSMYNFVSNDGPLDPAGPNRVTMIEAPGGNFALVGGIIPTSVATTSAGAIDFVTVESVAEGFDVIPLPATGYTTSLANAGALSNVRLSANEAIDVAKTVNAILIDPGVSVTGNHTLTLASGAIVFNGTGSDLSVQTLSPTNARIFVEDASTATINSQIVSAANLGKSGPGKLVLTGDNTYSGNTIVGQGVLNIQRSSALGSNAGSTTVNEGARIELEQTSFGPIDVSIEALALRGTGPDGLGVLRNIAGDNSWAGAITMSGSVIDQSITTGGVSQTANVVRTTNIVDIAAGSLDVSGVFGSTGNDFIKLGTGTLELSGVGTGLLNSINIIAEGKLLLNKVPGISPLTGTIFVGNGTGANDSAELELAGSDQIPDNSAITVYDDGLLDLNGNSDVTGAVNLVIGSGSAGDINIGTGGTFTPNGQLTVFTEGAGNSAGAQITGGTYALQVFGTVTTVGSRTFQVNDGASGDDLTITSAIVDGTGLQQVGLIKTGLGTLNLGGLTANTFTGTTDVQQGHVTLNKPAGVSALGGALTIGSGNVDFGYAESRSVTWGASNQIPDFVAPVTVQSTGLLNLAGFSETLGNVDAQTGLTVNAGRVTTGAGTLTLNGNLTTAARQGVSLFNAVQPAVIEGNLNLGSVSRVIDLGGDQLELPYEAIISANISDDATPGVDAGLIKNNTGHLLLSGNNTYSGDTFLNSATNGIAIGSNTALGTGRVYTLSGAALSTYGGPRTLANDLFLLTGTLNIGNTLQGGGGGDVTFTGAANVVGGNITINVNGPFSAEFAGGLGETISGANLVKDGFGTLVISDTATLSGSVTINQQGGAIILKDDGTLLNVTAFTVSANGTLQIDNSGTALENRIGNTAGVTLNGGTLATVGQAGAATSEILGTIALGAGFGSQIEQLVPTAAGSSSTLTTVSLTRAAGSTATFFGRGRPLGEATGNEIISVAVLPGLANNVFPHGVINNLTTGTPALDGMQFLHSKGPGTAIRPLTAADGLSTDINTAAATNSVRITADQALTAPRSVNAVMIVGTGVDVTGGFTLTVTGGPLAASGDNNTIATTGLVMPADSVIYNTGDVNISALVSGAATGLTKGGPGNLIMSGAAVNTFAGTSTVAEGTWTARKGSAFGAAGGAVTVNYGAGIVLDGTFTVTKTATLTLNGQGEARTGAIPLRVENGTTTWTGPVAQATNRTAILVDAGDELIVTGIVSGQGVNKFGEGTLELGGTAANTNIIQGIVWQGTLELNKTAGVNALATLANIIQVGDYVGGENADRLVSVASNQISDTSTITINGSGVWNLGGSSESFGAYAAATTAITLNQGPTSSADITMTSGTLTIVNSGTVANVANIVTGTLPGGAQVAASISGGTLTIDQSGTAGSVNTTITVADSNSVEDLVITSTIASAGGDLTTERTLTKAGNGRLVLAPTAGGGNTFLGRFDQGAGETVVRHNNSLGATDAVNNFTNLTGGSILIETGGLNLGERFNTTGAGFGNEGAILNQVGNNELSGSITLAGTTRISVAEGTALNISGAVTGGAVGIDKFQPGTLQLSGTSANTYTGTTQVHEGTLELNKTGVIAIPGNLVLGNNAGGDDSGLVTVLQQGAVDGQLALTTVVTVGTEGRLNLNGFNQTLNPAAAGTAVSMQFGNRFASDIATGAGVLTMGANANLVNADGAGFENFFSASPTISGNLNLANADLNISATQDHGVIPHDLTISATINGGGASGTITKAGPGTLVLSGNNTDLDGTTTLSGGTLLVAHNNALGGTGIGLTINTATVSLGAIGNITLPNPIALTSNVILRGTETDSLTLSGLVTQTGAARSITRNAASGATFDLTGGVELGGFALGYDQQNFGTEDEIGTAAITGAAAGSGLTKAGVGGLLLSGANTYVGTTSVNAGLLRITNNTALGSSLAADLTSIAAGASLIVDGTGGALNVPEALTAVNAANGFQNHVTGGLRSTGAVNTWSGTLTIGTAANHAMAIGVDDNELIFTGNIANNGANAVGFTKTGPGILELSGAKTYTGGTNGTIVREGILRLNGGAADAFAGTQTLTIGDHGGGYNSDQVVLVTADEIPNGSTVTVNSSGLLSLDANNETIAALNLVRTYGAGGQVHAGTAILDLGGNVAVTNFGFTDGTADTGVAVLTSTTGSVELNATRTFTVDDSLIPGAAVDFQVDAFVNNGAAASGITTNGIGTTRLTGDNAFTGTVTVGGDTAATTTRVNAGTTSVVGGTLELADNGDIAQVTAIVVRNGATLRLDNTMVGNDRIGNTATINLAGASLEYLGLPGGGLTEEVGAVTINPSAPAANQVVASRGSRISLNLNGATSLTELNLASLTRNAGGVLSIEGIGDNLEDAGSATSNLTLSLDAAPAFVGGILPWATITGPAGFDLVRDFDGGAPIALGRVVSYDPITTLNGNVKLTADNAALAGANTINALLIDGNGVDLNLNGNTLTIGTAAPSGLIATRGDTQTISNGTLAFGGREPLFLAGTAGTDAINVSAGITGTAALRKEGPGSLTFSGDNTGFSGTITVNQGSLTAASNGALGANPGGAVTVNNLARLVFDSTAGSINLGDKAINALGSGLEGDALGAVQAIGGNTVTVGGGTSAFNINAGTTAQTLRIGVTGSTTLNINGTIGTAIASAVEKVGTGTLTLSGTASNVYTGTTTVLEGTLILNKTAATALAGALTVGDHSGTDTVLIQGTGNNQIADAAAITITGGTLNAGTTSETTTATVTMNGGTITSSGAGSFVLGAALNYIAGFGLSTISGNLNLNAATRTITVNEGPALTDLTISALVSNGGISKAGAGGMSLSNPGNTFAGGLTLNGGHLLVSGNANGAVAGTDTTLGAGNLLLQAGTIVADGAARSIARPIQLTGNTTLGGRRDYGGNLGLTFTATVAATLTGDRTLTVEDPSTPVSITGNIGQDATNRQLTKAGIGMLSLGGNNSYAGTTNVSAGTLRITNSSALGTATNGTIVTSGAVLELDGSGGALTIGDEALTFGGANTFGLLNRTSTEAVFNGTVSNVAGNNTWGTGATAITIANGAAASQQVFVNSTAGNLTLNGTISQSTTNPSFLSKVGIGAITFDGTRSNNIIVDTRIFAGMLVGDKDNGMQATLGNILVGDNSGAGTDILRLNSPAQINPRVTLNIQSSGLVETTAAHGAATTNEVKQVIVGGTSGGFDITFDANTASNIAFNASAATVEAALNALPSVIAQGGVRVTGIPNLAANNFGWFVSFPNAPGAGANQNAFTVVTNAGNPLAGTGAGIQSNRTWINGGQIGGVEVVSALTMLEGPTSGAQITLAGTSRLDFSETIAFNHQLFQGGMSAAAVGASITGGSIGLSFADDATARTVTITVADGPAEHDLLISSSITDGNNTGNHLLTKAGAGRLTLEGDNTYGGNTTVNAGVLRIRHADALGDEGAVATTTVSAGALEIEIAGTQTIDNEILSITGSGIINGPTTALLTTVLGTGGLRVLDGAHTFSQNVSLGANTSIDVNLGDELVLAGAGILAAGGNSIVKSGGGTWELGGTVANTGTGTWYVNDGTVELNKTAAVVAIPTTLRIGDLIGGNNSAEVLYLATASTNQIGDVAISVQRDGRLNLNGISDTINNTIVLDVGPTASGDVVTGAGTLTNTAAAGNWMFSISNAGTTAASPASVVSGNLNFGVNNRTFDIRESNAPVELDIQAVSADTAGGLIKASRGTLAISGTNSGAGFGYNGATTVNADSGTLLVNGTIDGGLVTLTGSTVSGSTLGGTGTIGGAVTANNGTTINPGLNAGDLTGTLTITGALTFNGGATFFVDLNTDTAGDFDQIVAGAAVATNAGSLLAGNVAGTVTNTDSFLLINKTAAGAIGAPGFLNALPQPTGTTTIDGKSFGYNYADAVLGNGNDFVLNATAALRIWDGGSLIDDLWTTPENWVGDVAPFAGDNLLFPEAVNEAQRIEYLATGGTFTISFGANTTGNLPFNLPASGGVGPLASIQNALNALLSISAGGGSVTVTGEAGNYTITFSGGPLAGVNQPQVVLNTTALTGLVGIATVTTVANGAGAVPRLTPDNDYTANTPFRSITINTSTVSYDLISNSVLLEAVDGGILNAGTNTISLPLNTLTNPQTITAQTSGTLTLAATADIGLGLGGDLSILGTRPIIFNGTIDGSETVTINGTTADADYTFNDNIGGTDNLDDFLITTASDVIFNGNVSAADDFIQTAGTGETRFSGTGTSLMGDDIQIATITITFEDTGTLQAASDVSLNLLGGGNAIQTSTHTLQGVTLDLQGTGNYTLTSATNQFVNISGSVNGTIDYRDIDGLNVLPAGLSTQDSDVRLQTGGVLTINGSINLDSDADLTKGDLGLLSDGNVSQLAGSITSGGLWLTFEPGAPIGTANFNLEAAGNDFDTFASNTEGTVAVADADDFIVGSVNVLGQIVTGITAAVDVQLQAGTDIHVNSGVNVGAGDLTLQAQGVVDQLATILATGLRLLGAANFTLNLANAVTTIAANVTGTVQYTDTDALIVGAVTDTSVTPNETTTGITSTADVTLTSAGLTINEAVATGGADFRINSSAAVTQTAAITGAGLQLTGAGPFTLTQGTNDVTTIAASTTGTIQYTDATGLDVGSVTVNGNPVSGINSTNNDVTLTSAGLTISQAVATGTQDFRINSSAAVTQTAAITGAGLQLTGAGPFTLTLGTNDVATIAASTTGAIQYTDATGLDVGSVTVNGNPVSGISSTNSDVTLTSAGLTISQAVATGIQDFRINSSAAVTQTAAISGNGLQLTGDGPFTLTLGTNNMIRIAAATSGPIQYTDSNFIDVGSVTVNGNPVSGINSTNSDVTLTSNSVTISQAVATGSQDFSINSSLGVTQTAAITGAGLQLTGAGTFTLTLGTNDVATIAANTSGPIQYTDATGLDVGSVTVNGNAVSGITSGNSDVTLSSAGLTISQAVATGSQDFRINSSAAVTQTAAITGTGLQLTGAGPFTLTNASNNVATIAANTTGAINYADSTTLSVGTVNVIGNSVTGITTAGAAVTINTVGLLSVDATIDTTPGGPVAPIVGGNVALNAALVPGAGLITLNPAVAGSLVIAFDQTLPSINWSVTENIIVDAALVTTTGSLSLTADSDVNGTGGLLLTAANGSLNSFANVSLSAGEFVADAFVPGTYAAAYFDGGATLHFSIVIEDGSGVPADVVAAGNVSITGNAAVAAAAADVQITGQVQAGGTATTITSHDDIALAALSSITNLNVAGVTTLTAGTLSATGDINGSGTVTSATVDLNADAGIGNVTALNLVATTITADTTNGNIDLNNTQAAATLVDSLTTGTGTITFDQTGGGAVTFDPTSTTDGAITLRATGGNLIATSVSAGGIANVQLTTLTSGNVTLGAVSAAGDTVFVDSVGTILDDGNNATLVVANTADLDAAGDIGASGNQVDTTVAFLTALATGGSIFLDETDGLTVTSATATGGSNDVTIRSLAANPGNILVGVITAPDVVTLTALNGSILEDTADVATDISASDAQLSATGSIGASSANGDIDTAIATLTATSTTLGGIYLTDVNGLTITSATTTDGEIFIDAARTSAGNMTATQVTATGTSRNVRLRTLTATSDVLLGLVTAAGDTVAIDALGEIIDNNAGVNNVAALNLVMITTDGIGNGGVGNDIDTTVTNLAAQGGSSADANDVRITNTGALTLNHPSTFVPAVPAGIGTLPVGLAVEGDGNAEIVALSPLTVAANVVMGGSVVLTAFDSAAAGDILTVNTGILVRSTGSTVTLNGGDGVSLVATSVIRGFSGATINVDNSAGPGANSGSSSTLDGAIRTDGGNISIISGDGADIFTQTGVIEAGGSGDVQITLNGGADQFNAIVNTASIDVATGDVAPTADTITIDAGAGQDIIRLFSGANGATLLADQIRLRGRDGSNTPDEGDQFFIRMLADTALADNEYFVDGDDPTDAGPAPVDFLTIDFSALPVGGIPTETHLGNGAGNIMFAGFGTINYIEIENTTALAGKVNHVFDLEGMATNDVVDYRVVDVQLVQVDGNEMIYVHGSSIGAVSPEFEWFGLDDNVNSLTFAGRDTLDDAVRVHGKNDGTGALPSENGGLDGDTTGGNPLPTVTSFLVAARKSIVAGSALFDNGITLPPAMPVSANPPAFYYDGRGGTNALVLDTLTDRNVGLFPDAKVNSADTGNSGDLAVYPTAVGGQATFLATYRNVGSVHLKGGSGGGGSLLFDASNNPATTLSVANIADPSAPLYDPVNPVNNTDATVGVTPVTLPGVNPSVFVGASQLVSDGNIATTRFGGFAAVTIRTGSGNDTLDLISIDPGTGGLATLNLDGDNSDGTDTASDTILLRSLPAGTAATLLGGAGADTFRLGGETTVVTGPGPATNYTNPAGGNGIDQDDTVNNIQGPVLVVGSETMATNGASLDQLIAIDSGDSSGSGDTITVNAEQPGGASENYLINGMFDSRTGGTSDITFRGIDNLTLIASQGNDSFDAQFVNTTANPVANPALNHDLNLVNLNGWTGNDNFLLFTSDQWGGTGPTPNAVRSGVQGVALNGDYFATFAAGLSIANNPNANDGNDTFGETPASTLQGTSVASSVRMLRPSVTTQVKVDGGSPNNPLLPGELPGDVINIDFGSVPVTAPVVFGTSWNPPQNLTNVPLGQIAPNSTMLVSNWANVAKFSYIRVEDLNLADGASAASPGSSVMTSTNVGDFYARGTNGNDNIMIRSAITVNSNLGNFNFVINQPNKAVVYGRGGNDTIAHGGISNVASAVAVEFYGEDGTDNLSGSPLADKLVGGAGNDSINAYEGDNTVWGDKDPVEVGLPDTLANRTTLAGDTSGPSAAPASLYHTANVSYNDLIAAGSGNDRIYAGPGNDGTTGIPLSAGAGNDWVYGGVGDDAINGGGGNDRLYGGVGHDTLTGDEGHDLLAGNDGNDALYGKGGNDVLIGGAGNDMLQGDGGNDLLLDGFVAVTGGPNLGSETSQDFDDANDKAMLDLLNDWFPDSLIGAIVTAFTNDHAGTDSLRGGPDAGDDTFGAGPGDTLQDFGPGDTLLP